MPILTTPDAREVAAREGRLQKAAWYTFVGGMGAMGLSMLPPSQELFSPWSPILIGLLTLTASIVLAVRMSAKNLVATDAEISGYAPLLGEVPEVKQQFASLHAAQDGVVLRGQLMDLAKMAREHIAQRRKQALLNTAGG